MVRVLLPPIHPVRPVPIHPTPDMPPLVLQAVFFIALLTVASAIDIRKRVIPNSVCVLVALTGLICFSPVKLLGMLAALPLLIAALHRQGSIGGGDIKLAAACDIVLGFEAGITGLCLGLSMFVLWYAIRRIAGMLARNRKKTEGAPLPMAPFLSIGYAMACMIRIYTCN